MVSGFWFKIFILYRWVDAEVGEAFSKIFILV